jgi:diadenosine tetraphosphate (Ap4A) HIT family hydrolase
MTGGAEEAGFVLHPRLEADTRAIGRLGLSRALLMNDARFPWVILVPERPGITEIHHLPADDQAVLMTEIARTGAALEELYAPDKINVGALGNLVPQLHVHVVARRSGDAAWPGPVWGCGVPEPYDPRGLAQSLARIGAALA